MAREGEKPKMQPLPDYTNLGKRWGSRCGEQAGLPARLAHRYAKAYASGDPVVIDNTAWKTHTGGVRLWNWMWVELIEAANALGVTRQAIIRQAVQEYLEARKRPVGARPRKG